MLALLLALLNPISVAGDLGGEAGVCLLRPHRASGQGKNWVVWLSGSQIGMLSNKTYYCFKTEPGVLEVELTETSATHVDYQPTVNIGSVPVPVGEPVHHSQWSTRTGWLEVEALADETVFYQVKRKRKGFKFEEVDRDVFERLKLTSSR